MGHCVFCKIVAGELPATRIHEDDLVLVIMDIYPLRRGHVLVIAKAHHQHLHQQEEAVRTRLIDTATRVAQALYKSSLAPAAVHYVVNDGPASQQTVPHVHLHVLPRYQGDQMDFMVRLLRKPLDLLLGPKSAVELDADAAEIRRHLP